VEGRDNAREKKGFVEKIGEKMKKRGIT